MKDSPTIWSATYRSATIGFFSLAFLVAYATAAVTTAMPRVAEELNGLPLYGLAFSINMATSVISMTLAALWIDKAGPQKPLIAGVSIYVLGLAMAATANSMEIMVAARALQGLGAGLDGVALYVAIARVFPAHLRPKMFGALAAAWVLPSIIGPAFSGYVTDNFGWRWVFGTIPILAVIAIAIVIKGTRGTKINMAGEDDPASALKKLGPKGKWWWKPVWAGVASLSVLMLGDALRMKTEFWIIELLLAAALLVCAFAYLLPAGTWTLVRGLPTVILMRGLMGTAFTIADVYLPLFMINQRGLSASVAGLSLTVGGVTWAIGAWMAGRGKMLATRAVTLGAAFMLLGMAFSALVLIPGAPVWIAWIGWIAAGFGIGLAYPTQSVLVLEKSPVAKQGENSSALQLSETLTTSVSLAAVGGVFAMLLGLGETGFVMAFGVAIALAAASLVVSRRAA